MKFRDNKGSIMDKGPIVHLNDLGLDSYEFIYANGKSEVFHNIEIIAWTEIDGWSCI